MVSTLDFEPSDPSSNLAGTYTYAFFVFYRSVDDIFWNSEKKPGTLSDKQNFNFKLNSHSFSIKNKLDQDLLLPRRLGKH